MPNISLRRRIENLYYTIILFTALLLMHILYDSSFSKVKKSEYNTRAKHFLINPIDSKLSTRLCNLVYSFGDIQ